ncbi:MAG: IPTL-CTERM sorting domain-containing protein [Candidatus Dadabacteria bacterium]|nr:MAG: IPTL-CTERM sorting domain-containing protein [Candidatus Dadabacteria bacterium]
MNIYSYGLPDISDNEWRIDMLQIFPIPTLSEWGLIAMVAVIGIAGVLMLRKRLASAK